jgi:16S rRNA (guanine966-N2)-methyltransferase
VGIEALSRSAAHVYFIESSRAAVNLIRQNLASLQIKDGFDLLHNEASPALRSLQAKGVRFDHVFLDPPYRVEREYEKTLEILGATNLLKEDGVVIAEHSKKFEPMEAAGELKRYRKLIQGDAALSFYSRIERKHSEN